jgi:hypothetical protein
MISRTTAAVAMAAALCTSCAPTTYDSSLDSTIPSATTSTVPTGTPSELLPRLVDEVATLSGAIVDRGDRQGVAERVDALWIALEPQLQSSHPDLIDEFRTAVALVREAAERNRAADADKALRNLTVLADAVLG